jgi:hypothetical protein
MKNNTANSSLLSSRIENWSSSIEQPMIFLGHCTAMTKEMKDSREYEQQGARRWCKTPLPLLGARQWF